MTLFGQYTQWLEFVGVQLAAAEIDEAAARDALERYKSIGLLNHSEGSKTVTAAKAKALSSPEYEELSDKYNEAHAYRKIITAMYESTEHKQRFVSRELSRRIGRADTDRREGRWAA
ncbi:hypothetical protein [Actinomadura atramentaria]|uniref:hypothetical protein n=1 Tax=Actinomadura atramentaria TaxID=1990 RepID=UPI00039BDB82|nr:hypothetical protein [Actinomadura atramentaria]